MADHDFETVSTETLYSGTILALRADEVRMPGGVTATREVVEHYGAVAVAAVDDEEQLAMVYQYRQALGRRLWELPAGLLDEAGRIPPTRPPANCARRPAWWLRTGGCLSTSRPLRDSATRRCGSTWHAGYGTSAARRPTTRRPT